MAYLKFDVSTELRNFERNRTISVPLHSLAVALQTGRVWVPKYAAAYISRKLRSPQTRLHWGLDAA